MRDDDFPECATTFSLMFYGMFSMTAWIMATGYIIFAPFKAITFITTGATLGACLGAVLVLKMLKMLMDWVEKMMKLEEEVKHRNDLLIGFGGIALCGLVPRILVYFIEYDPFIVSFGAAVSQSIICTFYFFFLFSTKRNMEIKYETHKIPCYIMLGIHIIVLLVTLKIGSKLETTENCTMTVLTQLVYCATNLVSTTDFLLVMLGRAELEERRPKPPRRIPVYTPRPPKAYNGSESPMDLCIVGYGFLTMIAVLTGFCYLATHPSNFLIFGATFLACGAIFGAGFALKCVMVYFQKSLKQLDRARWEMLVGLGGIMASGIVPRIAVFFVEVDVKTIFPIFCIILASIFTFYIFFVFGLRKTCSFNYSDHGPLILITFLIHFCILLVNIRIGMLYEDKCKTGMIILVNLFFSILCFIAMMDFGIVLMDGFQLRPLPKEEKAIFEFEAVKVEAKPLVEPKKPKVQCPTCQVQYSDALIPRILKECGHTICEECADKLLLKNHGQYLNCPKCQQITVVQGAASQLRKNYVALELAQDE